jgi:hypothetical protein
MVLRNHFPFAIFHFSFAIVFLVSSRDFADRALAGGKKQSTKSHEATRNKSGKWQMRNETWQMENDFLEP